jgi:glycosyltransferase involved in cell wall biosynthesis
MAPGATSHPLRAFFRWKFVQNQKRICRDAFASAYVTSAALQRRYPPSPGKFTTSFSDVVIKPVNVAREQFPSQGPYRLIAIGTLATMYKGYDVLLHAVAKAIGAGLKLQLVIIGDGQHLPSMKQLAQALGIGDRVNFRGLVPFGDPIFAELDGAHLFVMPSRQEGLPRAMVEAMARALPCIGTSVGGIPELLEPTELIPPNDVPALSAKLVEVLTDPQRMMKLSKRNLEVAGNFTENVLRSRRLEFYQYLLAGTETWRLHSPPL